MNDTNIGWTDFSSSPVKYREKSTGKIVWACVMASPGCQNCYSQSLAARWNKGKAFTATNIGDVEPFLDKLELNTLLTSKKIAGKRVFIEDMSDLFGAWVPDEMIEGVFAVMALRPDVTFQVLTKRAARMAVFLTSNAGLDTREQAVAEYAQHLGKIVWDSRGSESHNYGCIPRTSAAEVANRRVWPGWPLPNVLVGFSAENQEWFDKRWPHAKDLAQSGWKTWVSAEPLLGGIDMGSAFGSTNYHLCLSIEGALRNKDFTGLMNDGREMSRDEAKAELQRLLATGVKLLPSNKCDNFDQEKGCLGHKNPSLSWGVVGGESGRGRRECEVEAITDISEQFKAAEVPLYVKQDSGLYPGKQGRIPLSVWEMKGHAV